MLALDVDSARATLLAERSRLEALPWAAHCIGCQREIGRGAR